MNKSGMDQGSSNLESKVASELSVHLEKISVGAEFKIEPSAEMCFTLERYIPQLLSQRYLEWQWESLDGIFLNSARKTKPETAELTGLCILIRDQTVTPFFTRLLLSASRDSTASYLLFLGEPGSGHLGISGPSFDSTKIQKMLENVGTRLHNIRWSYAVTSDPE